MRNAGKTVRCKLAVRYCRNTTPCLLAVVWFHSEACVGRACCCSSAQDLHTSAQQAAGAIGPSSTNQATAAPKAAGKSSAARSAAAAANLSLSKRREVLLSAADVLLTCAVTGGMMSALRTPAHHTRSAGVQADSDSAAAAHLAAIAAAAKRANLPEASHDVEGAVAPPVTPQEQTMWLRLTVNAFRQAGWQLEAGQLLLSFGPDYEDGRYVQCYSGFMPVRLALCRVAMYMVAHG
jgi:hypothetical protein